MRSAWGRRGPRQLRRRGRHREVQAAGQHRARLRCAPNRPEIPTGEARAFPIRPDRHAGLAFSPQVSPNPEIPGGRRGPPASLGRIPGVTRSVPRPARSTPAGRRRFLWARRRLSRVLLVPEAQSRQRWYAPPIQAWSRSDSRRSRVSGAGSAGISDAQVVRGRSVHSAASSTICNSGKGLGRPSQRRLSAAARESSSRHASSRARTAASSTC